jgi:hypothetical protein
MNVLKFARCAVGILAGLALLTGCNAQVGTPSLGSGAAGPQGTNGVRSFQDLNRLFAMSNAAHRGLPATQHPLAHSWMHKPPKGFLGTVWATDLDYASVDVIAYPSGTLIGQIAGFSYPYGDCSDKNGNVYVADFSLDEGFEIQAGTTKVINSWPTGGEAIGCSVSNSGDVSFTNFYPGGVVDFPGGGPSGITYSGPGYDWPAGYDPHGNLFVLCNYASPCSSPHLAELPAGSGSWNLLNLNEPIVFPGAAQWMDKYLGVADQNVNNSNMTGIDLVRVSGSNATVVKTITLGGGSCSPYMDDSSSWGSVSKKPDGIVTKKIRYIIGPNLWCLPSTINVYKAKGGQPINTIVVEPYQLDYGVTFTKP